MNLSESKFYYAGQDMNFAVFSDYPCRVKFVESICLPMDLAPVEIYSIEPAARGQWIVVEQRTDGRSSLKLFFRDGSIFRENRGQQIPEHLKEQIMKRVPKFSWVTDCPWAA